MSTEVSPTGNISAILRELEWLEKVIYQSIATYLKHEGHEENWKDFPLPQQETTSVYGLFIEENKCTPVDRLLLALVLAPHFSPEILDVFFGKNQQYDRPFTEFGGLIVNEFSGFLPTVQTAQFIVSTASDEAMRVELLESLDKSHFLIKNGIVTLADHPKHLPQASLLMYMDNHWQHYFITGVEQSIEHSTDFPAHAISTPLEWSDLVVNEDVYDQLKDLETWSVFGKDLMNNASFSKKIKPGYRALFYGPPGTGKTLTASLLGKTAQKKVYRVDLSMVSSKYIGETEKNLAKIFDAAENRDWILFFDEADSLFGKRTTANSSNDRHANQQTGFLLQRIEDFPGVIILASNLKDNIDPAFIRRFQSIIHFKMPDVEERFILWKDAFDGVCELDEEINLYHISEQYEIAGGAIINILRHCLLQLKKEQVDSVSQTILMKGIRRELAKEHKTLNINA